MISGQSCGQMGCFERELSISATRSKAKRLLGLMLAAFLTVTPIVAVLPAAAAVGVACPSTPYLPDTNSYPNNYPHKLAPEKYLLSNSIYYKLNKNSEEAIAVGYVSSFVGALTIPENLSITASEIQAAGFDSTNSNCLAFAKTYKVLYIGPDAFAADYGSTKPVLSSVNIEANLKVIGKQAFLAQCRIEALVIPDSVTDIGKEAFGRMISTGLNNSNCGASDGLKSVTLGVNLKRFYENAFNQAQLINSLTFRGQPLSSSPGDFPAEYDLWNVARNELIGRAINNACNINFTYALNLSVQILAGSLVSWTPWALANNCFTQEKINTFTAVITTPPAQAAAPVASNPTQSTADVTFTAPASDGGSSISSYVITSVPGALTATSTGPNGGTVTVTGLSAATTYSFRVQAVNANGTASPSALSNQVVTSALTAPDISLSSTNETSTLGSAISGYAITNAGGVVASYSISPSVGNGLSFNSTTGILTGTPSVAASAVLYTITGTNNAGSDTATFTITVAAAPAPSLSSTPSASPLATPTLKSLKLRVTFGERSSELTAAEKKKIRKAIATAGPKVISGTVVGYVQRENYRANDKALSAARAKAVVKFLRANGVKVPLVSMGKGALNSSKTSRKAVLNLRYSK